MAVPCVCWALNISRIVAVLSVAAGPVPLEVGRGRQKKAPVALVCAAVVTSRTDGDREVIPRRIQKLPLMPPGLNGLGPIADVIIVA